MEKYLSGGIKEAEQSQFQNRRREDARADPVHAPSNDVQAMLDWTNNLQLAGWYDNNFLVFSGSESNNQLEKSHEIVPDLVNVKQASLAPSATNVSTAVASQVAITPNQTNLSAGQASQAPSSSRTDILKRSFSELSKPDRKKVIDRTYREKRKRVEQEMISDKRKLTENNEYLKKENQSLKKNNALMNQTLKDQEKEMVELRNAISHLKQEYETQNFLVRTLSGNLGDPVQLENEKLKEENALLRKNGNNSRENTELKHENKVLNMQWDALCGKIISDNKKKHEEENAAKMPSASMYLRTKSSLL